MIHLCRKVGFHLLKKTMSEYCKNMVKDWHMSVVKRPMSHELRIGIKILWYATMRIVIETKPENIIKMDNMTLGHMSITSTTNKVLILHW